MKNRITCKDCWWFKPPLPTQKKGYCLTYGIAMNENDCICCEYARGKRCIKNELGNRNIP